MANENDIHKCEIQSFNSDNGVTYYKQMTREAEEKPSLRESNPQWYVSDTMKKCENEVMRKPCNLSLYKWYEEVLSEEAKWREAIRSYRRSDVMYYIQSQWSNDILYSISLSINIKPDTTQCGVEICNENGNTMIFSMKCVGGGLMKMCLLKPIQYKWRNEMMAAVLTLLWNIEAKKPSP